MKESVDFVLTFSSDFIKTAPEFQIVHNESTITDKLTVDKQLQVDFELFLSVNHSEKHCIKIIRTGFDGCNEQLLRLDSIIADSIDLHKMCYSSRFFPEYPEPWASEQKELGNHLPQYQTGWIEWGWNGIWVLEFDTPFYTWLLENA